MDAPSKEARRSVLWVRLVLIIVTQIAALVSYFWIRSKSPNMVTLLNVCLVVCELFVFGYLVVWYSQWRKLKKEPEISCYTHNPITVLARPESSPVTRTVFVYVPVERPPSVSDEDLDDEKFWCSDHSRDDQDHVESCPICLNDADIRGDEATGSSKCCNRYMHVECAQRYFISVRKVQCPFCRSTDFNEPIPESPKSMCTV